MIFSESSTKAHSYLFLAGIILFVMCLVYVFGTNHQRSIEDATLWKDAFRRSGIDDDVIPRITHDDSGWFLDGRSLCVNYGEDPDGECNKHEGYCSGNGNTTFGTYSEQSSSVKQAILNDGEHPLCPLIYPGTE